MVQTGIASWYVKERHGHPTASGEIFDMERLTAAHATLPLGTQVRVIRLGSGRSIIVRINDRGPFVRGRIIGLSAKAAEILGFKKRGSARMRLEAVGTEIR